MQNKVAYTFFWINLLYFTIVNVGLSKDNAKDLIKKGLKAHNGHERIDYFKQAVTADPSYNEAYFELGYAYYDVGDYKQAENALDRALQVSPDNIKNKVKIRFILELARVYVKQKRYDYAINSLKYINEIAEKDEIKSLILFELGNAYLFAEEFDKALVVFNTAVDLNPKNIDALREAIKKAEFLTKRRKLYDNGKEQLKQKKFDDAVKSFAVVNKTDSSYRDVNEKLLEAQDSLENQKRKSEKNENELPEMFIEEPIIEEVKAAKPVVKKRNTVPQIEKYYKKGEEALKNENWNLAIEMLNKVDKLDSKYKNINSLLIEANLGLETSKVLERAVNFYNEGLEHTKNGDYLMAIISFEKTKMLFPGYKDVEERIEDAKKYMSGPDSLHTASVHAVSPMNGSNKAWFIFSIVFSAIFLPITVIFFFSPEIRARYFLMQGNYQKASQIYERILQKNPDKTKVYITLANIYLNNNRSDERALKVYKGALEQELDSMTKEKIKTVVKEKKALRDKKKNGTIKLITEDLKNDISQLGDK